MDNDLQTNSTNGYVDNNNQIFEKYEIGKPINAEPVGLGGWLIIVGIGRVLNPIILIMTIINTYLPQITSDLYDELSQPGNDAYSSLWKPTFYFELYCNALILIISVILLVLFFRKKKLFPTIFICTLVLNILFTIIDAILITKIQDSISIDLQMDSIASIIMPIFFCIIWIPYILTSKRVKNTFVK